MNIYIPVAEAIVRFSSTKTPPVIFAYAKKESMPISILREWETTFLSLLYLMHLILWRQNIKTIDKSAIRHGIPDSAAI